MLRRTLGLSLSFVLALAALLVLGPAALAAPAGGGLVYPSTGGTFAVDCPTTACTTGPVVFTASGLSATTAHRVLSLSTDPRTLPSWPSPTYAQLSGITGGVGSVQGVPTSGSLSLSTSNAPMLGKRYYLLIHGTSYSASDTTTKMTPLGLWDTSAEPPAPTTTAPPTTTTPPSTTTPPTTEPPSTTTPPPSGGGTGMSCTEEAPCPVRVVDGITVDAGSINVSALTEEQWGVIELGLASLVFFSGASFAYSWRTARGGR